MEQLRQILRGMLGASNPMYLAASRLTDSVAIIASEGVRTWSTLRSLSAGGDYAESSVQLRKLLHPIALRAGSADVVSVISNCIREEYGQIDKTFDAKFIIDAGAYIGDTAAYFMTRFPACFLVALEPHPDSYERARLNLIPYGSRVELVQGALLNRVGAVSFGGEQTAATVGQGTMRVSCVSMDALLARYSDRAIVDILKLDIEGAEVEVLRSGHGRWLARVRLLLLETHGTQIEAEVLPLLTQNGFTCRRFRNLWYCRNMRLAAA